MTQFTHAHQIPAVGEVLCHEFFCQITVDNLEELKLYASQIEDYVVQPFVDGKEYTIDIFCDWDGTPISIVPRERMRVRAGEVLKTRIDLDSKMIEGGKEYEKS